MCIPELCVLSFNTFAYFKYGFYLVIFLLLAVFLMIWKIIMFSCFLNNLNCWCFSINYRKIETILQLATHSIHKCAYKIKIFYLLYQLFLFIIHNNWVNKKNYNFGSYFCHPFDWKIHTNIYRRHLFCIIVSFFMLYVCFASSLVTRWIFSGELFLFIYFDSCIE